MPAPESLSADRPEQTCSPPQAQRARPAASARRTAEERWRPRPSAGVAPALSHHDRRAQRQPDGRESGSRRGLNIKQSHGRLSPRDRAAVNPQRLRRAALIAPKPDPDPRRHGHPAAGETHLLSAVRATQPSNPGCDTCRHSPRLRNSPLAGRSLFMTRCAWRSAGHGRCPALAAPPGKELGTPAARATPRSGSGGGVMSGV
jgi:hypothetical protein